MSSSLAISCDLYLPFLLPSSRAAGVSKVERDTSSSQVLVSPSLLYLLWSLYPQLESGGDAICSEKSQSSHDFCLPFIEPYRRAWHNPQGFLLATVNLCCSAQSRRLRLRVTSPKYRVGRRDLNQSSRHAHGQGLIPFSGLFWAEAIDKKG